MNHVRARCDEPVHDNNVINGAQRQTRYGALAPNLEEMTMLRKLALAFVAAASLGAVALAPTVASAAGHGGHGGGHGGWHGGGGHGGWHGGHGGWHGGGYHRGWGGPHFYVGGPYAYGGCTVRRLVPTPWGPRWRWVNRCY